MALQRLKDSQRARNIAGQKQGLASASDADNEAYMQQFNEAFRALSTYEHQSLAGQLTGASAPAPAAGTTGLNKVAAGDNRRTSQSQNSCPASVAVPTAAGWTNGPLIEAGTLVQLSDRPILCSAANWSSNEVVVGCSDHASYVVDLASGNKKRTLYSKSCGHTEWVTCVCYLPQGRVLTGGMDGRCWLWPSAGSNGTEVKAAHEAPVSKVVSLIPPESAAAAPAGKVNIRSHRTQARATASPGSRVLAASCSYDKSVKMWDFTGNRPQQLAVMTGHAGPVLEMAVQPVGAKVLTGDRKGNLMSWDLETCSNSWGAVAAHQGHITALAWMHPQQQQLHEALAAPGDSSGSNGSMAVSGGQDGCVRLWDTRASGCAAQQRLHANQQGKGAVGNICIGGHYGKAVGELSTFGPPSVMHMPVKCL
eukprot:GHRR01023824.1.p1 GENE.GHRR01023824.1~~GHRR01023824.1.p1  ORF type:complete len:422 (+),score=146.15 GHRR01023824.1:660-1925(+)